MVAIGLLCLCTPATAQNDTATYEYDALGRLTRVAYPSGHEKKFDYDPAGNRTEVLVLGGDDGPVNDNVPTLGIGPNLINLSNWPKGSAPAGPAYVDDWPTWPTYYEETRWARVTGPGESNTVTAMESGQTEPDNNGGGTQSTNTFTIDETKGYEYSIYFRKYDLIYQSLYFGVNNHGSGVPAMVKVGNGTAEYNNPYFLSWSPANQADRLDADKWYRIVSYVLPEGFPVQSNDDWGGIYDVATGEKIWNVSHFRWNENRDTDLAQARFFTYYSETQQDTFTTYFYLPEVRITDISYVPFEPSMSITETHTFEGEPIYFDVNLSQSTTVDVKVNYVVGHPGGAGSASGNDYTAASGTLAIPQGAVTGTIAVDTTQDSLHEGPELIRLTLSSPVHATISEATELAEIVDDDAPPSFSVNDVAVTEGGTLTFTITRTNATNQSYTVDYATSNGSAVAGSDYTQQSGTLTFAPSQGSHTVSVPTTQDESVEADEYMYLVLSNASGAATISDNQGIGTINNDDIPNSPPIAVDDSYLWQVDCCGNAPPRNINPTLNDSDPDSDPLTIISITQPPGSMTATIQGSTSIRLEFNSLYYAGSFAYTVSDGNGGTATATIYVEVETNE